jgi:hypothetical protein
MSALLREILDRIEYERLIEEGKDPKEVLHYKFKYIPSEIIDSVIDIDPTKKKSYSQWLLSKWDDEKNTIVNNLKNGRIAKLFQHYKEHNDIQIKDCPSVKEGLDMFVPNEDTVLVKSTAPMTTLMNRGWTKEVPSELANDFDVVFNEDNWVIAVPNTYEADCKLGENMNWCTAGGRSDFAGGRGYYNRYLSDYGGKYYVNFDMTQGESRLGKDYPFTRYQFHFESNQFMDKEDDPVDLAEINMPESAKEFYSNEGYDTDQFENFEARMERYNQQRWDASYRINDDLYLGIAYDEDFQFEEPNEGTDFYLFSIDDDRDPLSWDEIPNPHTDEGAVILNNDSICIFKKKYGDDGVVVAFENTSRGWSTWEAESLKQYIMLPNNLGLFGIGSDSHFTVISSEINEVCDRITVKSCENIFVNEQCTRAYNAENKKNIFVETVSDGYHSLFNLSMSSNMGNDLICVVYKDIPANGEYFTINKQGLVEGEFRTYRVYDDDYYGGADTSPQWNLESKLGNGDYLISVDKMNGYGRSKAQFNILKRGTTEPLIKDWFDEYIGASAYLYLFKKDAAFGFYKISDGEQVGEWYDGWGGIDRSNDILYGIIGSRNAPQMIDAINGSEGRVTATFKDIVSTRAANNKIIIQETDGFTSRVYDYMENKFYFPELSMFRRINQYDYPFIFVCKVSDTEEMALFDLSTLKVLSRNIKKISRFNSYDSDFITLEKMDGKFNVFDMKNSIEMLPNDVDAVTSMNTYIGVLVYESNGKAYPYDYRNKRVVINPNGFAVPTYANAGDKIYCQGQNYNIYFIPDGNGDFKFYKWQNKSNYNDYGTNFDPQHTPQEVMNMYNLIYGQQESIIRNFKNYVKRINEAMKYRYNDIID